MSFLTVKSELHLQNKLFHELFLLTFKIVLLSPAVYGSRANTMCIIGEVLFYLLFLLSFFNYFIRRIKFVT